MVLVVVVVVAALLLGRARGGRVAGLGGLSLRRGGLAAAAVAAALGSAVLAGVGAPRPAYAVGLAVSALLSGPVAVANRRLPGIPLITLGLLLNAMVVAANGAMPVSPSALARAGVSAVGRGDAVLDPGREPVGPGTRLRPLGDVIPVALPLWPQVISPGDALVAAGLAQLVVGTMGGPGLRRRLGLVRGARERRGEA